MRKNTDQNNSEYGHFLRSDILSNIDGSRLLVCCCANYKPYRICFVVDFMIFRTDVLKNTSGFVLLDKKSVTMCVRFKTFRPSVLAGFFSYHRRLRVSVYTRIKIDNSQNLCADKYLPAFQQKIAPNFASTWYSFLDSFIMFH